MRTIPLIALGLLLTCIDVTAKKEPALPAAADKPKVLSLVRVNVTVPADAPISLPIRSLNCSTPPQIPPHSSSRILNKTSHESDRPSGRGPIELTVLHAKITD